MSATVTPGIDRWRDDRSRAQSVSAANDDTADANGVDPAAKRFLAYAPFAKQAAFHASSAKYRLFGGAAGPGKSMALLMEAIIQADEHPGVNTLLLRRTFPELEQSLLQ